MPQAFAVVIKSEYACPEGSQSQEVQGRVSVYPTNPWAVCSLAACWWRRGCPLRQLRRWPRSLMCSRARCAATTGATHGMGCLQAKDMPYIFDRIAHCAMGLADGLAALAVAGMLLAGCQALNCCISIV